MLCYIDGRPLPETPMMFVSQSTVNEADFCLFIFYLIAVPSLTLCGSPCALIPHGEHCFEFICQIHYIMPYVNTVHQS